ncbi:unnamed protein product [Paramecium octaurelia]|uniref:Uncharacterized protein n=1 Tax=Paramecium octaurelia TaxID=43137 RepID=A0A8S1YLA4_PAROT|nr:unnamed protein product [Paramecium octaurelia]
MGYYSIGKEYIDISLERVRKLAEIVKAHKEYFYLTQQEEEQVQVQGPYCQRDCQKNTRNKFESESIFILILKMIVLSLNLIMQFWQHNIYKSLSSSL